MWPRFFLRLYRFELWNWYLIRHIKRNFSIFNVICLFRIILHLFENLLFLSFVYVSFYDSTVFFFHSLISEIIFQFHTNKTKILVDVRFIALYTNKTGHQFIVAKRTNVSVKLSGEHPKQNRYHRNGWQNCNVSENCVEYSFNPESPSTRWEQSNETMRERQTLCVCVCAYISLKTSKCMSVGEE